MNFLDFFFIVSGTLLFFLALDVARKQRFSMFHLLIFLSVGVGLLVFTFFPYILDSIGSFFGIARGADALVYISIIFLLYFSLLLLSKHFETKESITQLVRELAIAASDKKILQDDIVILIRAYNESKKIQSVIDTIIKAGHHSILIVDDGSSDGSKYIYKLYQDKLALVTHRVNRGAGAALETGFEYLRRYGQCQYVVCFDADGQHDITDLPKFLKAFEEKPELDVVIGSRFLESGKARNIPLTRKMILIGGKIFTTCMSRIRLSDAHNGYRVFRYTALEKLSLSIDGMGYASELTEQIARRGITHGEVPVTIHYDDYSLEKGQSSGNAFGIALRFIWTKFFR